MQVESSIPNTRRAEVVSTLFSEYRNCNRWAIIVGISKYRNARWNLKYADQDAKALSKLLQTDNGGGFDAEYICELINETATTKNITKALRSFLQKPAREDLVIIYLACHGSPDLNRPDNVYLLTHDTDPTDIAGTALPMREINLALTENLLAEKVIILADTCHSAAIGNGAGRRSTQDQTALVNRYLQQVSAAKGGIALITSAEANEASFEDAKWGGGHGVFTYHLLEGMRGFADRDQNGIVSIGELFEYVRDNVKQSTAHQQHPCIGTNPFDRNLPVSVNPDIKEPSLQDVLDSALSTTNTPVLIKNSPSTSARSATKRTVFVFVRQNPIIAVFSAVCVVILSTFLRLTIFPPESVNKDPELPLEEVVPHPETQPETGVSSLSTPGLEIWYYPQQDSEQVSEVLNLLSVKPIIRQSQQTPAVYTNSIWFGNNVSIKDVKLVAKQLVESEIPIQAIRPFSGNSKASVIEVGTDREIEQQVPSWTLEQIDQAIEFNR